MDKIYFDNAATTPMDPRVADEMIPFMKEHFGNPSSIHSFGRKTKSAIEKSRKIIADHLGAKPGEIIFTSGGTEADNLAIHAAVEDLGVDHIISSPVEHHAVLHTVEYYAEKYGKELHMVRIKEDGHVDLDHLEELLSSHKNALVSLMHGNNEIGNLLPLKKVGEMCAEHGAYFHSDTVQTMGHYPFDLSDLNVHFVTCGAHKFHGPKGVGFLYVDQKTRIQPLIHGGGQERKKRGGTENLYGIIGLGKAMDLAHAEMNENHQHIKGIKERMIQLLEENIPGVGFNGDAKGSSLYTVLNVCFPEHPDSEMLLFNLDLEGIAASGGSACTSGSDAGSHVLQGIGASMERPSIRFSFGKFNAPEEADRTVEKLKELFRSTVETP